MQEQQRLVWVAVGQFMQDLSILVAAAPKKFLKGVDTLKPVT